MNQVEYLLKWMQRHGGVRFTPAELREQVSSDFKTEYGRSFGDPGKAARVLVALRRIQRTEKGIGQSYWYNASKDSKVSLEGVAPGRNQLLEAWKKFLGSGAELDEDNWDSLFKMMESELSAKERRELKSKLASILSRTKLNPVAD
jgi:hypothetical protein